MKKKATPVSKLQLFRNAPGRAALRMLALPWLHVLTISTLASGQAFAGNDLPDLRPEKKSGWSKTLVVSVNDSGEVSVQGAIKNPSKVSTKKFTSTLYLNGREVASFSKKSLASGHVYSVEESLGILNVGHYTLEIMVDSGDNIREHDEKNNRAKVEFDIEEDESGAALIEDWIALAESKNGQRIGECKMFLANTFNTTARSYSLPNGRSPTMPLNRYPNEGTGIRNWYWVEDSASGFVRVGKPIPVDASLLKEEKRKGLTLLLASVRKGDTLQMVMRASRNYSEWNTSSYVPHTITFTKDAGPGNKLSWVESNLDGKGTVSSGSYEVKWDGTKTFESLLDRVALPYGGATLYRVRDDLKNK